MCNVYKTSSLTQKFRDGSELGGYARAGAGARDCGGGGGGGNGLI